MLENKGRFDNSTKLNILGRAVLYLHKRAKADL